MANTSKKPMTGKKKVALKDLKAKDTGKVKGGMNKAELLDAVAKRAGVTKA